MKNYKKTYCIILFLIIIFSCKKDAPLKDNDQIISDSVTSNSKSVLLGRQNVITLKTGDHTYPTSEALLWIPFSYRNHPDRKRTFPLIINLYGQAQCGSTNLNKLLDGNTMSAYIAEGFNPAAVNPIDGEQYSFFVCSPQCPTSWGWSASQVYNMLEELKKSYPIDTTRIYITGFSCGGWGLWSCMTDKDKLTKQIAAIVPISSASADHPDELTNVDKYKIACLNICGDQDAFYSNAIDYTNIINSDNPSIPAELNTLHDVGHGGWKYAYDNTWKASNGLNIYEWMLQYKRK
jgi:predicted peptidase